MAHKNPYKHRQRAGNPRAGSLRLGAIDKKYLLYYFNTKEYQKY